MPGAKGFTDLLCWRKARQLSKAIFERTQSAPFKSDRRLVEQINDSSESVMSNIAEGFGRGMQNECITFFGYAMGSLDETRSHLCAAYDRRYLTEHEFAQLWGQATEVRKMSVGFVRSTVKPNGEVRYMRRYKSWTDQVWETYERLTGEQRPELFRTKNELPVDAISRNDSPPI